MKLNWRKAEKEDTSNAAKDDDNEEEIDDAVFPRCWWATNKMVLLSALNKLKDFVVWSWTYLWAIWFLLVSLFYTNSYYTQYKIIVKQDCYKYIDGVKTCQFSGCICVILLARTFENQWKYWHGCHVFINAYAKVLCGIDRHLLSYLRLNPYLWVVVL